MTSRFLATTAALALAATSSADVGSPTELRFNDPADVAVIEAIEETLATELDVDKLLPLYADDAVVLDLFAPGVFRGKDEIRAGFAPQLGAIRSLTKSTLELIVATNGKFGCAASQLSYRTVMKDGRTFRMNVRVLDAFKKIDGKWKVIQQHLSLPVDPVTLAARADSPIAPRAMQWSAMPLEPTSTSPEAARTEIREFMEIGGASVGLDKLMNYYGPGDDILLYDAFSDRSLFGRKEIADFYAPIMNSYDGISLEMPLFVADSDGSFGVQIDTQRITLNMKDGTTRKIALRQSDCMRRIGGKWFSFMEMVSYPVDANTMKALVTF